MGLILWPHSKRSVSGALAKVIGIILCFLVSLFTPVCQEIAAAAREGGAEPVGVFVDENVDAVRKKAKGLSPERSRCVYKRALFLRPRLKNRLQNEYATQWTAAPCLPRTRRPLWT